MAMQEYGWTIVRIKHASENGWITFEGGTVDGLSNGTPALDGAKVGETWAVKVEEAQPFAFGEIKKAVRLEEAT